MGFFYTENENKLKIFSFFFLHKSYVWSFCWIISSLSNVASPITIIILFSWPNLITIPLHIEHVFNFLQNLTFENQARNKQLRTTFVNIFLFCEVFFGCDVFFVSSKTIPCIFLWFILCMFTKVLVKYLVIVWLSKCEVLENAEIEPLLGYSLIFKIQNSRENRTVRLLVHHNNINISQYVVNDTVSRQFQTLTALSLRNIQIHYNVQ